MVTNVAFACKRCGGTSASWGGAPATCAHWTSWIIMVRFDAFLAAAAPVGEEASP
jgi:predicted ATP-dependent serine protease